MRIDKFLAVLSLGGLLSCGYSEESFQDDYAVAWCDKAQECDWLDLLGWTPDECLEDLSGMSDTGGVDYECDFQSDAAKACVEETTSVTCESFLSGEGTPSCSEFCI